MSIDISKTNYRRNKMIKEEVFFNKIFVLQSLEDKNKTGDEIARIIRYVSFKENAIQVELSDIADKHTFFQKLELIKSNTKLGVLPLIHFEMHGSKDGFHLIDDDTVKWAELKPLLTDINVRTNNNLFVALSTCYGAHLLKACNLDKPSPFFGYIGPVSEIGHRDLENAYTRFYETLLTEMDFEKAINSMHQANSKSLEFNYLTCFGIFDYLDRLHKEKMSNPRIQRERIKELTEQAKKRQPHRSKTELRKEVEALINTEEHLMIENMRKVFTHQV